MGLHDRFLFRSFIRFCIEGLYQPVVSRSSTFGSCIKIVWKSANGSSCRFSCFHVELGICLGMQLYLHTSKMIWADGQGQRKSCLPVQHHLYPNSPLRHGIIVSFRIRPSAIIHDPAHGHERAVEHGRFPWKRGYASDRQLIFDLLGQADPTHLSIRIVSE